MVYPRNEIISINYILSPERKLSLNDIFHIENAKSFFSSIIDKYSNDREHKETLLKYLEYYSIEEIPFSINEKSISISFLNYIPKVVQCYAFIDFPLKDFEINIGDVYNLK